MKRLLLLPLLLSFSAVFSQVLPPESLIGFESEDSPEFLDFLTKQTADKRVVGMGEVSHYTRECYTLKSAAILHLMDEGFDGLILEVDAGQAQRWNGYLLTGKSNLDTLVASSGWFTYRTAEFRSLLAAIRSHNEQAEQPFQVFGMEMTAMNHSLEWLHNYLESYGAAPDQLLTRLKAERPIVAFQSHNQEQQTDYWNLYHELTEFLAANEAALLEEGTETDFAIADHFIEMLRQYATYVSQDDFGLKSELRDQFSARNVWWCLEQMGEESQAIIWAHNGHVAKHSVLFNYDILGHYLEQWFGEAYYSLGFSFNAGEFGAFSEEGFQKFTLPELDTTSLSREFATIQQPFVLLDVRNSLAKDDRLSSPLRQAHLIRRDVSEYYVPANQPMMEINLARSYDALLYIHRTTYPTTLDWIR
ncbi:MAG: erythromycin esterase family protein [Bacteroidota bacterium]